MSDNDNSGYGIAAAILAHGQAQINQQNRMREKINNDLAQTQLRDENEGLADNNRRLNDLNNDLEDEVYIHQRRTREAWELYRNERKERNRVVGEYNQLVSENNKLQAEAQYYKSLLCKPMLENAEANGDFKKTYEEQNNVARAKREIGDLESENAMLRKQLDSLTNLLNQPLHIIAQHHPGFAKNFRDEKEKLADWMVAQKAFRELAIQLGAEQGLSQEQVTAIGMELKISVLRNRNNPQHGTNSEENFFHLHRENLISKHLEKYPNSANSSPSKDDILNRIKRQ